MNVKLQLNVERKIKFQRICERKKFKGIRERKKTRSI